MPRNYVRKTTRGMGYTFEELQSAIQHVRSGRLTVYAASKKYNIPRSTINTRMNSRNCSHSMGRPTALPLETEIRLANAMRILKGWGFRLSKQETTHIVAEFIKLHKLNATPFKNSIPGSDWFTSFCKRHLLCTYEKELVKTGDPFVISEYFVLLRMVLENMNSKDRPPQIWNLTETSMELFSSQTAIEKDNITVVTAVNANGDKLSPFITFNGKQNWTEWMVVKSSSSNPDCKSYEVSDKGRTKTNIMHSYMSKLFVPSVGSERPILILYDGKNTLIDIRVVELAERHNIIILKLPSQMSPRLQPLDFVFETLWEDKFIEWQKANVDTKLTKNVFVELIVDMWDTTTPEMIRDGFKTAGINPYNSDIVPKEEYDENAYKRWRKMAETVPNVDHLSTSEETRSSNISYQQLAEALGSDSQEDTHNSSDFCIKEEPTQLILEFMD